MRRIELWQGRITFCFIGFKVRVSYHHGRIGASLSNKASLKTPWSSSLRTHVLAVLALIGRKTSQGKQMKSIVSAVSLLGFEWQDEDLITIRSLTIYIPI